MFLIIGIPSIKLSELAVDLSQRNIFVFILQACLRRQEYKRDPNEKKRDQFWGQETNFERSRFSSGSSSKQVLRTLGDTFCCRGCVCVCVSVKNFKGQGRERQRPKLSSWVPPLPGLLLLCCVTLPLHPVESHSSFLYIKGTVERYHPNQKRCGHLRAGGTGPSKVQYHIYIPISLAPWSVYTETYAGLWSYPLHCLV